MTVNIEALKRTSVYAEESFVVDAQAILHGLMEDKGMTRADLAAAMGVSRARVTQLFSSECKNFTIRLLARAFHAVGEAPELTCAHIRKQEQLALRRAAFGQKDGWAAGKYSFQRGGPTNDNLVEDASGLEVASAPNDPRLGKLVSTLGRTLMRERVAA